jgi:hypothetical protein
MQQNQIGPIVAATIDLPDFVMAVPPRILSDPLVADRTTTFLIPP